MPNSKLDRRQFIRINAIALAGAAIAPATIAGVKQGTPIETKDGNQPRSPGFYRFAFGDLEITILSDGHFHYSPAWVGLEDPVEVQAYNADPETREEYFRSRMVSSKQIPLQASPVLIDTGDRRILLDSGTGTGTEEWPPPPNAGRLGLSLEAAGISPGSIDQVILTHAHFDHMGGLIDPATRAPFFPNAEVIISEEEFKYWMSTE